MSRPILHLISQAHLDPVWLWPERDGIAEALTTMQSAVDRAAEFPDFKFTRSSAAVYRWAEEMDPRLFASIQELVQAGRWEVVGGMIEQPDCNLPSTESFLRQALYAKRYFRDRFGAAGESTIGYVPDSFGHAGGLPQILRHGGFDAYVFMRPQPENGITLPLLFQWQSEDGSQVLGIRIPIQYSQSYAATADEVEAIVRASATQGFAPGFQNGVMWFGVGNHGGGPTREHLRRIIELQSDESLPEIRFSTVREFVAALRGESAFAEIPVVDHELQYVFRGCYAATGETKQQHRACEKQLFAAEALAVQSGHLTPESLHEAWWQLGYNQFHDILAGTCIHQAQEDIRTSFGKISTSARQAINRAAFSIARDVDTHGEPGSVLTVVNPLPWSRHATVELDTFSAIHGRERIIALEASDGTQHPVQWIRPESNFGPWGLPWGRLCATLPVPAGGHRTFRVITESLETAFENPFSGEDSVSTEQFIKTGESTHHERIEVPAYDRLTTRAGYRLLAQAPSFIVIDDPSGTWGHGVERYDQQLAALEFDSVEQIEEGPVLTVTRHKTHWQQSTLLLDLREHHLSGDVEIRVRFNWQQERQLLKLAFATPLNTTESISLNPGSIQFRPTDGRELPCHDWVALQGEIDGSPVTFALGNDSSYSYSAQAGELRMTLARGVPHAEHPPFEYQDTTDLPFLDQGWQERRFWLDAGDGPWQEQKLAHRVQDWQIPAVAMLDSAHQGTRPREASGLEIEDPRVAVLALKTAEDRKRTILRLQELSGVSGPVSANYLGSPLTLELNAWQIQSYELTTANNEITAKTIESALEDF